MKFEISIIHGFVSCAHGCLSYFDFIIFQIKQLMNIKIS
jgi:hypothetical protein